MYQPDFPPVPYRLGLYPVVDSVAWIARLLEAGVRTLQLRIKDKRDEEVEADVVAAIALGRRYNARLFINDYWRLAVKHRAYGVHLGQEDLETTDLSAIRDYPTVAIGGISLERAPAVLETGVGSIAVVSAITQAADWQDATEQLLQLAGAGDE